MVWFSRNCEENTLLIHAAIFLQLIPLAAAAAAAKSLQSCPALCDPIDGSPPGSPILPTKQKSWKD